MITMIRTRTGKTASVSARRGDEACPEFLLSLGGGRPNGSPYRACSIW